MGSSLGPVLANIILTELEKTVISDLIRCDTIKFYKRYVDDTLLLIKPSDILTVLAKFNEFDKNLKFTAVIFPDGVIHFLDIKISVDGTDAYRKDTHTDQYTHFSSFESFSRKTAWIKSLFYCAFKICTIKKLFENQTSTLKSFLSWNGYPNSIKNYLIDTLKHKYNDKSLSTENLPDDDNLPKLWIRISYLGKRGKNLVNSCLKKTRRCLTHPVKFIVINDTNKISYFISKKDRIPDFFRSNLVYQLTCPGCN